MKMLQTSKIIGTTTVEIHISAEDFRALLKMKKIDVPDTARVIVRVPGGGDWSNTDLEIGSESFKDSTKVTVRWVEHRPDIEERDII